MQDLVRVGVADAVQEARVREGAAERVPLPGQRAGELGGRRAQDVEAAGVVGGERRLAPRQVDRRPAPGPGLGQGQRPVRKVERREPHPARRARAGRAPVKPAGDHQVDDDEQLTLEREDDALPQAAEPHHGPALDLGHRRIDRAEDERARQTEPLERPPEDARLEGRQVRDDVG